jgi:hypothetical protein
VPYDTTDRLEVIETLLLEYSPQLARVGRQGLRFHDAESHRTRLEGVNASGYFSIIFRSLAG